MRKTLLIVASVLLLAGMAAARKQETVDEMKAKAEASSNDHKPQLYTDIVHREIEDADKLYTAGDVDKAQAMVKDAVSNAEKARDAAFAYPHKLKHTEIHLRKAERRLSDIRRTLSFEDQPAVEEAVNQIAAIRKQILDVMFAPKQKKK